MLDWLVSLCWGRFVATEGLRKVWVAPFVRARVLGKDDCQVDA